MTTTAKQIGVVSVLALVAACFLVGVAFVKANPPLFTATQTNTATSTVVYITPGLATTTLLYDANVGGDAFASNGASLLIMFTGSSTASTLNADIQYSQNGIDWFNIGGGTDVDNGIGSTSPSVANPTVITMTYASTSPDRSGIFGSNVSASSTNRIVNLDMPTRYVRALFYLPIGSLNGGVWAQFVAQKQNR